MTRRPKTGLSLVEVVVAIGIAALAAVAMYGSFSSGYRTVYRSRYASMAAQVARESLEELQQIACRPVGPWLFQAVQFDATGNTYPSGAKEGVDAANVLRNWREPKDVVGSTLALSVAIQGASPTADDAAATELAEDPLLEYPPEYGRLRRTIVLTPIQGDPDIIRARVTVTWQEEGVERAPVSAAVFETLLVRGDTSALAPAGGTP